MCVCVSVCMCTCMFVHECVCVATSCSTALYVYMYMSNTSLYYCLCQGDALASRCTTIARLTPALTVGFPPADIPQIEYCLSHLHIATCVIITDTR